MTRWLSRVLTVAMLAVGLVGCGGTKTEPKIEAKQDSPVESTEGQASASKAVVATTVSRASTAPKRDRLHQSFTEAVRNADNPPPDAIRPPDQTVSKKPVHRILETVKSTWDDVRFTTEDGKPIQYRAKITTSEGTIEIELYPELAPNHVRNFVTLARAGYYDELFFERIRHDQNEQNQELHLIEAGCPLGTGAIGPGSIGYWLKEEFTPGEKMSHVEGTIGACRGEEPDSAATRFYVCLTKAPFLDGSYTIFGKVVAGIDVLRKIGQSPVIVDDEGTNRPEKPIVIQEVTIQTEPK